jgi:hypothetical protein
VMAPLCLESDGFRHLVALRRGPGGRSGIHAGALRWRPRGWMVIAALGVKTLPDCCRELGCHTPFGYM